MGLKVDPRSDGGGGDDDPLFINITLFQLKQLQPPTVPRVTKDLVDSKYTTVPRRKNGNGPWIREVFLKQLLGALFNVVEYVGIFAAGKGNKMMEAQN